MRSFNNHYRLKDISDAPGNENELIADAIYDNLPLAIWAVGCFIGDAARGPDNRRIPFDESEMEYKLSGGEWLYLDSTYIPLFLSEDRVEMGFYRSSPESPIDKWARRRDSKIVVSLDMLYVPEDSCEAYLIPELPPAKPTKSDSGDESAGTGAIWVFRETPDGTWECGDQSAPTIIKGVTGFFDMAFAIRNTGEKLSPAQLPGGKDAFAEVFDLEESLLEAPEAGLHEPDGPFLGHGSDYIMDPKALRQARKERKKIICDIEVAKETGDDASLADAEQRLLDLEDCLGDATTPWGQLKKLDGGDLVVKGTKNARDRKRTALKKLRSAGLTEMAGHLKNHYKTPKRMIIYLDGEPFPKWILDKQ